MGNKTINALTSLSGVASADLFPVWDASGAVTRKATLTDIFAVLLAQANTFTTSQTLAPTSTSVVALFLDAPAGTTPERIRFRHNGSTRIQLGTTDNTTFFIFTSVDLGNNFAGPNITIGRNTNAVKPGAGHVILTERGGTGYRLWVDNTGVARIGTSTLTYDTDVSGTVIGTQTSNAASKNILGEVGETAEALRSIVEVAKNGLKRFTYRSGSFGNQEFEGVITDLAPRYGMDRDDEHPAGKSLNEIQLFGDLIRAVALIAEKLGLIEEE